MDVCGIGFGGEQSAETECLREAISTYQGKSFQIGSRRRVSSQPKVDQDLVDGDVNSVEELTYHQSPALHQVDGP